VILSQRDSVMLPQLDQEKSTKQPCSSLEKRRERDRFVSKVDGWVFRVGVVTCRSERVGVNQTQWFGCPSRVSTGRKDGE
jgi:hypothetical protein